LIVNIYLFLDVNLNFWSMCNKFCEFEMKYSIFRKGDTRVEII